MTNVTVTVGRVVRDIQVKKVGSDQKSVAGFTLAVDRPGTYGSKKKVDFLSYVVWQGKADSMAKNCLKGTLISVTGMTTTRNYKDKSDRKVRVTEIIIQDYAVLQKASANKKAASQPGYQDNQLPEEPNFTEWLTDEDVPF